MKYTKKQRHDIYEEALKLIKIGQFGVARCLCDALNSAIYNFFDDKIIGEVMDEFPEVKRQQPKHSDLLWFPMGEKPPRIAILKKAIELTE